MVVVDAFGERIPQAQEVDQLTQRVGPEQPVLLEVKDQLVVEHGQVPEQALVIVEPQPAKGCVTLEVVQQVRADGPGNDLPHQTDGGLPGVALGQNGKHGLAEPFSIKNRPDGWLRDVVVQAVRALVVPWKDAPLILEGVPERYVSDIVQQRGHREDRLLHAKQFALPGLSANGCQHLLRQPAGAQAVLEPGVRRRREYQVRSAELLDPAQALERRGVDNIGLQCAQADITVNGFTDRLCSHGVSSCRDGASNSVPSRQPWASYGAILERETRRPVGVTPSGVRRDKR